MNCPHLDVRVLARVPAEPEEHVAMVSILWCYDCGSVARSTGRGVLMLAPVVDPPPIPPGSSAWMPPVREQMKWRMR